MASVRSAPSRQGQQADGLQAMRQAFLAWARDFTTDLGVSIPIDYLVTVGTRV